MPGTTTTSNTSQGQPKPTPKALLDFYEQAAHMIATGDKSDALQARGFRDVLPAFAEWFDGEVNSGSDYAQTTWVATQIAKNILVMALRRCTPKSLDDLQDTAREAVVDRAFEEVRALHKKAKA